MVSSATPFSYVMKITSIHGPPQQQQDFRPPLHYIQLSISLGHFNEEVWLKRFIPLNTTQMGSIVMLRPPFSETQQSTRFEASFVKRKCSSIFLPSRSFVLNWFEDRLNVSCCCNTSRWERGCKREECGRNFASTTSPFQQKVFTNV